MSTFANKYPSNGTWTTAKLFSFHRHVNQMPRIWYHAKACCVAVRLTVSQRDPPLGLPRPEQDHFSKFPHKRKQISRSANCPSIWCCVRVPSCSWPRPRTATICWTWRSNHVTEARVHRDVAPPCAPVISGRRAAVDVPLLLCFMHHNGRDR